MFICFVRTMSNFYAERINFYWTNVLLFDAEYLVRIIFHYYLKTKFPQLFHSEIRTRLAISSSALHVSISPSSSQFLFCSFLKSSRSDRPYSAACLLLAFSSSSCFWYFARSVRSCSMLCRLTIEPGCVFESTPCNKSRHVDEELSDSSSFEELSIVSCCDKSIDAAAEALVLGSASSSVKLSELVSIREAGGVCLRGQFHRLILISWAQVQIGVIRVWRKNDIKNSSLLILDSIAICLPSYLKIKKKKYTIQIQKHTQSHVYPPEEKPICFVFIYDLIINIKFKLIKIRKRGDSNSSRKSNFQTFVHKIEKTKYRMNTIQNKKI